MKKLFCLLITLFGCLAQEAGGVRFQFGNEDEDIVSVRQSIVDQSGYISRLVREVGPNVMLTLPEEFGKADLQNIIDYLDIPNVPESFNYFRETELLDRDSFLRDLSEDKVELYRFLKLLDYLILTKVTNTNYIFDTEIIKELSHLGFANEIFASSLRELVRKKPKAACELYSSLEDGNQIKDLLADILPLWNLSARLGAFDNQNPGSGHIRHVRSVALSKDGKTIVSGSWDTTIIVWQKAENGVGWRMVQRFGSVVHRGPIVGHANVVTSVDLSKDGKTIVSGSGDKTIIVWQKDDAGQWQLISRLGQVGNEDPEVGHTGIVTSVDLSADGKTIVSGSRDKTLIVWQKDDATEQWQLQQRLGTLDQSSEGIFLQALRVSGLFNQELEADRIGHLGHVDYVTSVALSNDGKTIVSGSDDERLIVWEKNEFGVWQIKQILGMIFNQNLEAGHVNCVTSVALSNDGKTMVSGSDDKTVIVWQKDDFGQWSIKQRLVSPGGPKPRIRGQSRIITYVGICQPSEGKVKSVNISEDGKTIGAGFEGGSVWVWRQDDAGNWFFRQDLGGELISEHNRIAPYKLKKQTEDLRRRLYGSAQSGSAQPSNIDSRNPYTYPEMSPISDDCHGGQVNSVALNNDGEMIVSGSDDGTVIVWEKKSIQDYCAKLFEASEPTGLVETSEPTALLEAPKKGKASKLKRLFNYILKRVRGDRGAR